MPWCPNCKNEYVDGIKECADCHVTLVEQLEEDFVPVIFGEEEEIYKLNTFLEANEFTKAIIRPSEEDNFFELVVPASLATIAVRSLVSRLNIELLPTFACPIIAMVGRFLAIT